MNALDTVEERGVLTLQQWLQETFGYTCRDLTLFEAALTHRSAGNPHNERLEYLGDAVLNCVTATVLYQTFPNAPEGELSRYRSSLVSGESLATLAAQYELGERVRLGSGELKSGGFRRKSILSDTLEAVIGAIYLDAGFAAASQVIERMFAERLLHLPSAAQLKDPKTRLQEALQSRGMPLPEYRVAAISGEPHAQRFTMRCEIHSLKLVALGEGSSRRIAEQEAAQQIFEQLTQLRLGDGNR